MPVPVVVVVGGPATARKGDGNRVGAADACPGEESALGVDLAEAGPCARSGDGDLLLLGSLPNTRRRVVGEREWPLPGALTGEGDCLFVGTILGEIAAGEESISAGGGGGGGSI